MHNRKGGLGYLKTCPTRAEAVISVLVVEKIGFIQVTYGLQNFVANE